MGKKDKNAAKTSTGGLPQPVKLESAWTIWTTTVPDEISELVGPLSGDPIELYEDFKLYLRAAFREQGKNKMIIDDRYTSSDQLAILCDASYTMREVEKNFGLCRIVAIAQMAKAQRITTAIGNADEQKDGDAEAEGEESPKEEDGKETTGEVVTVGASESDTTAHSA